MPQSFSTNPGTYTLSDIVALTRAKKQWVTRWGTAGALKPVRGTRKKGMGVHRRFHEREVLLAAILTRVAVWGTSINEIAVIADRLRRGLFSEKDVEWLDLKPLLRAKIQALSGNAAWIVVAREGRGTRRKYHIGAVPRPDIPVKEVEIKGRNLSDFETVLWLNITEIWRPVMKVLREQ